MHHQFIGGQHIHDSFPSFGLQQVMNVERGFTKEQVGALTFQLEQCTLDGSDGSRGDVSIPRGVLFGMLPYIVEHGTQVLHVYNQQSTVVSHTEHDVENACLRVVEFKETRQQFRSHLRNGGTHGMPLLSINIEKPHRTRLELRIGDAKFCHSFLNETCEMARLTDTRQIAFHVSHEAGNARLTERFCHHLQANGFSCSCCSCHQSVSISHFAIHHNRALLPMCNV